MLKIVCDKCNEELDVQGGIAFKPPSMNGQNQYNLCRKHWKVFLKWIRTKPVKTKFKEYNGAI